MRTFVTASDNELIRLIHRARTRLVVVSPAFTEAVAEAVARRMKDLPDLSLTVVLDADAEVYRLGYGDTAALDVLRKASAGASFRLREEPGIRIGLVISDDSTLVFSPVSRNIEAGTRSGQRPNGILLGGEVTELLAEASGIGQKEGLSACGEIGQSSLNADRVQEMQCDLERTPPLAVDLTRKLNVFITRVQYVDLKVNGYQLSRRRADLPEDFVGMASEDLRGQVSGAIRSPIDNIGKLDVTIETGGKTETLRVDEEFLGHERHLIEKTFTHVIPGRGRILLRQDREFFEAQIERFECIITEYQKALAENLQEARAKFQNQFVDEFLGKWRGAPPRHLTMRGEPTEDDLKSAIIEQANRLFDQIVRMERPAKKLVYKEIAIEDLKDEGFMTALRGIMAKGGVKEKELDRLFEQGEAAAAQGSFPFAGAAE